MKITAEFEFEGAHQLAHLPEGHKCKRLHGHSWRMVVGVEGEPDERGFVMDYAELEEIVAPLVARFLNEIEGLSCPTTEVMVGWFLDRIKPRLPRHRVTVTLLETPRYSAEDSR